MCTCTCTDTHVSCCCGHSGRPVSTHRRISDSVSACEEGQQLLECSGGKGVGAVFLVVKAAFGGKVLRGPDCAMLELEKERKEGKGRAQDIKSVCFGFFWFYDPGMVVSARADDSCL